MSQEQATINNFAFRLVICFNGQLVLCFFVHCCFDLMMVTGCAPADGMMVCMMMMSDRRVDVLANVSGRCCQLEALAGGTHHVTFVLTWLLRSPANG
jgi:hypothetical protein